MFYGKFKFFSLHSKNISIDTIPFCRQKILCPISHVVDMKPIITKRPLLPSWRFWFLIRNQLCDVVLTFCFIFFRPVKKLEIIKHSWKCN